ncbi:MAG: hypothetical protein PHV06_08855 [bacterium]|nr:hypothetical protein [bacterium]
MLKLTFKGEEVKRLFSVVLIIFLCFLINVSGESPAEVLVFYDLNCDHCQEILNVFWPPIQAEKHYDTKYFEVNHLKNYEILLAIEEQLNDKNNEFPIFIVGEKIFDLYQIEAELPGYLDKHPDEKFKYPDLLTGGEPLDRPIWTRVNIENNTQGTEHPNLIYFYETGCKVCDRVASHLEYLKKKYPGLVLEKYEAAGEENLALFNAFLITYKVKEKSGLIPSVFIGDKYLLKNDLTNENLENAIKAEIAKDINPLKLVEPNLNKGQNKIIETFKGITYITIILAGLIDGINPCAFATLIFFISYLTVMGRNKSQVLVVSIGFTLSVFVTYFLISLGLFSALRGLSFLPGLGKILYLVMGGLTLVFSIISFYDYYQYHKGQFKKGILQISTKMRDRINRIIKKEGKSHSLFIGAVITGFIVSILEFSCTGQVLIPTLTAVMSNPGLRSRSVFLIFIYNLSFIIPLVIIFLLFYKGISSEKLGKVWKEDSPGIKLTMGIILLILSFLIFYFGVFS